MPLDVLCSYQGINTDTLDCAPQPGVFKYFGIWGGKLTKEQLAAGYATCKAQLIADSKLSKASSGKFMLFPIVADAKPKKEANTVAKLPDGSEQVTLEAVPKFDITIKTDMYQGPQLRKMNGKRLKYVIIDHKNQFLATRDENDALVGRYGKIYVDGIDAHGYDTQDGQTNISISAENAVDSYDNAACIQLDKDPTAIFKKLKDVQLYEKVAATPVVVTPSTRASRTYTITGVGADGDTFDPQDDDGNSLSAGPVSKTSSETTVTLLAAKIAAAITAAVSTNGGYTATNSAGAITILAPAALGATVNTLDTVAVIVGTITATHTAFTGGVTGTNSTILHISAKAISPNANALVDFYSDYAASALGTNKNLWVFTRTSTGANVPVTVLAPNAAGYFDVTPTPATVASMASGETLEGKLVDPPALDAAGVLNIESVSFLYTKP